MGVATNYAGVGSNDTSGGSSYTSAEDSSHSNYTDDVKTLNTKEIDEQLTAINSTKLSVNHPGTEIFSEFKNIRSLSQSPHQTSSQSSPDGVATSQEHDDETDTSELEALDSVDESVDDVSLDEDDEIMLARATTPVPISAPRLPRLR